MKKSAIPLIVFLLALYTAPVQAGQPWWWDSPHRDDDLYLYEPASASGYRTEQEAVAAAFDAARSMLMNRIGITPAIREAGLVPPREFALLSCEITDRGTELLGRNWKAWVMVRYPRSEQQLLLTRWEASLSSVQDLQKIEARIPREFSLSLAPVSGRSVVVGGEAISFAVTADRDCHLILLDHQSDGTTVLLFPNSYHEGSAVRAGETVVIPPPQSAFALVATEPWGDDRIEAIACTEESSLHSAFSSLLDVNGASPGLAAVTRGFFVKALDSALSSPAKASWSRAEMIISTYPEKK